jgi:hypothetical protein
MPQTSNSSTRTDLILNLAPVQFKEQEIVIGVSPYHDHEQLSMLRHEHQETHVFRREGDEIISVSIIAGVEPLGDFTRTIRLPEHLPLCAALIRNSLLDFLNSRGLQSYGYDPIEYVVNTVADDLLRASLPPGVSAPSWLSVRVLNTLTVRSMSLEKQEPFIAVALDLRAQQLVNVPCDQLIAMGLNIKGLYVSETLPVEDPRLFPRKRLLGRVCSVRDGKLSLEDVRQEDSPNSVEASSVYLEPRIDAFNICLKHAFKQKSEQVKSNLRRNGHKLQSGPDKLDRLKKRMETLVNRKAPFEMLPGVTFTFQPFLAERTSKVFPIVKNAERPIYVFDPTGVRTKEMSDLGLTEFGPYSAYGNLFTPNTPNIIVICQKNKKGLIEQFLAKFKTGIAGSRFATGFVGKYRLADVNFDLNFLTDSDSAEDYQDAANRAIHAYTRADKRIHLAFVQIEESFRELHGGANPYLVTKAAFLTHQIPVQEFTIQKATQPDKNLAHILNTMGLAIYAKLGGTPWLMPSNRVIAHELVFGMGSAQVNEDRFGEKRRYVGITTVFSGDGNYRLANLSEAVPFKKYQDALLKNLRETVTKVRTDNNWQPGDTVRLIFHAFKPMKYAEIDAVTELMKELGDYEVEFAFLHLAEEHPYLLFDTAQPGVYSYEVRATKGIYAPMRGVYFRLSEYETLMSLVGAREIKKPEDGLPRPLLLKLHPRSTFTDDIYLSRQVFMFSCHSWRNFTPGALPVTIRYSALIARMLGELETVPSWSPGVMYGRIGETRWFL